MYRLLIILIVLLGTFINLTAENQTGSDEIMRQNTLKMEEFKAKYGFKGGYGVTDDNRVFYILEGSFPLPEPVDTVTFKANCEKVSGYIMSLYKSQAANSSPVDTINWNLLQSHKVGYRNKTYFYNSYQSYNGFRLQYGGGYSCAPLDVIRINGELSIHYSRSKKQYIVFNNLFPEVITLGKPLISEQQALDIVTTEARKPEYRRKNLDPSVYCYYLEKPIYRGCYLSVIPSEDKTTHSFAYYYEYSVTFDYGYEFFRVDGMTGKISIIPKVD